MAPCRTHWPSRLAMLIAGWMAPAASLAQDSLPTNDPAPPDAAHPSLIPQQLLWPGVVIIVVIAIFVAAALAGPLIRANQDDATDDSEKPN